ncbi:MAG TPA: DinB family protein [Gemmatimonadaceae bacterium]|nr:DinB family protein [Gemmatimonadaceae bacterium]
MTAPELQLGQIVFAATPRLSSISEADASRPRSNGKWSRKEIVGHLIDSATNNHGRFVRAQFGDDLVSPTYDQDAWVRVQNYIRAPWAELVTLWSQYNLHLTRVIAAIPPEARSRRRFHHNLHDVAFRTIPASEPATLEYLIQDYVVHLEHHLAQIFAPDEGEMTL